MAAVPSLKLRKAPTPSAKKGMLKMRGEGSEANRHAGWSGPAWPQRALSGLLKSCLFELASKRAPTASFCCPEASQSSPSEENFLPSSSHLGISVHRVQRPLELVPLCSIPGSAVGTQSAPCSEVLLVLSFTRKVMLPAPLPLPPT